MYASPIDISSFTGVENTERKSTQCVFALDMGGSLAKLAYQTTFLYKVCVPKELSDPTSKGRTRVCGPFEFYDYREHNYEGHKLTFIKFEIGFLDACLDYIRDTVLPMYTNKISSVHLLGRVTGGGAFKYLDTIRRKLPTVEIVREDEMQSLVRGCTFLLRNIPDEVFTYDKRAKPSQIFLSSCMLDTVPFLLVNIGSGVSFLKVEIDGSYSRVGGTSLGGGTFWGVGALLAGDHLSFDELLKLADEGDHRNVDMLVKDIYGGAYESLGLPSDVIASSFGLAARRPQENRRSADMVKALLIAISNNIGQLAYLYAQMSNVHRILFGGFFIRGHALTMDVISFAINYWSKGEMKALFLRHEGYLGAVGAFMKTMAPQDSKNTTEFHNAPSSNCWSENYVSFTGRQRSISAIYASQSSLPDGGTNLKPRKNNHSLSSSSTVSPLPNIFSSSISAETLLDGSVPSHKNSGMLDWTTFELEHLGVDMSLTIFPLLLSPSDYIPDTWDLTQDTKARAYWLECFKQGVERIRQKAEESQSEVDPESSCERANQFAARYIELLNELSACPSGRGLLTVRCVLEAQQHFLREYGFPDAFCQQKKAENSLALASFPEVVSQLWRLPWEERQIELTKGLLTGNVFDWGASEAVRYFMQSQAEVDEMTTFEQTIDKLPPRPWLVDNFDRWLRRIRVPEKRPHCVLIFCDNSGADLILGVLPFVIECLDWNSKVILAANSVPAINDVTYMELELMLQQVANLDSRLAQALETKRLICVDSGQSSPCLDLRRISHKLVDLVKQEQVDLIIIEGMGRAIHTNLYARFCVDCLKVAVIKNSWLACRLGGELFSVIFQYEQYRTDQPPNQRPGTSANE